jgi:glutamine cyclotransferase
MRKWYPLFIVSCGFISGCTNNGNNNGSTENELGPTKKNPEVPSLSYTVTGSLPHDTNSFTEGFLIHNKQLFESTGATDNLPQTRSLFGIVDPRTGKIETKAELDRKVYFGEGIVFFKNKVYQLTYKNQIGFIYDAVTFKKLGTFNFQNKEGWGFTTDGKSLIMSDGTNTLTYFDPDNLKVIKTLSVNNNGYAEDNLNELEFIRGFIYANIWTKNYVVKIDPADGRVVGTLDLSYLFSQAKSTYPGSQEMNGIAYDSLADIVYITGKMWPLIYQIKFPH